MWPFKRKPKNKRHERHEVLHVRLSVKERRRTQTRWVSLFLTVSLGTLLVIYGLWRGCEWGLDRLVYHNRAYSILELDLQTDGVIAVEQLRRWAGVKLEDNLFAINLAGVKRDLELCSAIQSVSVERMLPHTLRIRVTERVPVAQFLAPSLRSDDTGQPGCYQFDAEGWVIQPLTASQRSVPVPPDEPLPLVTGFNSSTLRPGRQVESAAVRAALQLLAVFDRSPMAGLADLQQIEVGSPGVLRVTTAQNNQLTLRTRDLERQLRRWRLVHDLGLPQSKHIATLDLSVSDNAPLRWAEATAVPPVAPKARKPSPYRKRHV